MSLSRLERAQLRALIYDLPAAAFDRGTAEARTAAERIVEWLYLLPLARGEIDAVREAAAAALAAEVERQRRTSVLVCPWEDCKAEAAILCGNRWFCFRCDRGGPVRRRRS